MAIFAEGIVTLSPATPETVERFVGELTNIEAPLLARQGTEIAGGWRRWGDGLGQVMNVYRYRSLAAMQEAGDAQREDAEAMSGLYSWMEPASFKYRRTVHLSAPFSSSARLRELQSERPAAPRQYVELRRNVHFRRQEEGHDIIRQLIEQQEAAGLFRLALAYDTLFGEFGEFTVIGILPQGAVTLNELHKVADRRLRDRLVEVTSCERAFLLDPLPFSPLR